MMATRYLVTAAGVRAWLKTGTLVQESLQNARENQPAQLFVATVFFSQVRTNNVTMATKRAASTVWSRKIGSAEVRLVLPPFALPKW